jgi:hypothetical protein
VSEVGGAEVDVQQTIMAEFVKKAHESAIAEIEFRLAPDHSFWGYLQDFGAVNRAQVFKEGEGQGMLCIVDLLLLFQNLREELEERVGKSRFCGESVGLNIASDIGEINIGIEGGKIQVGEGVDKNVRTINVPQNLLVRSMIGYWDVYRLKRRLSTQKKYGEIPGELLPLLKVLFPANYPYTCESDYF